MATKLLILDLDETLIYATEDCEEAREDFCVLNYHVFKRPGLDQFLKVCFENFRVAVWTSSGAEYADQVVNAIFPDPPRLEFVWSRKRCTPMFNHDTRETLWIKDLKKVKTLGYVVESILAVDDTPRGFQRSYGNHVPIKAFCGERDDDELFHLGRYLLLLKDVADVRRMEKRHWRKVLGYIQQPP